LARNEFLLFLKKLASQDADAVQVRKAVGEIDAKLGTAAAQQQR